MEATKKCSGCGRELPLSEFNKCRSNKDGLQNRCRRCFSEYNKKRYAANPDKYKADVKKYRMENPGNELATRLKICERNPNQKNAYMVVDAALRCGVLVKPHVCSACGCQDTEHRIEAHHYDYSKPLDIIWLCTPCHRKADASRRVREGKSACGSEKPVLMKKDGIVICRFESIAQAAKAVGISPNNISGCLSNSRKTAAGYQWEYDTSSDELGT